MCAHPWHPTFHRGFWYVRQLRQLLLPAFHLRPEDEHATSAFVDGKADDKEPRQLLFISRKGCAAEGCDTSRNVRSAPALLSALRKAFPRDHIQTFTGTEPISSQASLFHSAQLIAGPHGAALANMIWCRDGTSIVEFHRYHGRAPNSPLYALLARSLQLRHWVVADLTSESHEAGYMIAPRTLIATVRAALAVAAGQRPESSTVVELPREEWT